MAQFNHLPGAFLQALRRNEMCHGHFKKLSMWWTTSTLRLSAAVTEGPASPSVKLKQVTRPGLSGVSYQEKR